MVKGIADGCELAGCALIGGETAEMPGMYPAGEYDLAGFCVGVVEKDRIIDGRTIAPGDVVLGLASSGPHSNGYSLIRRIIGERRDLERPERRCDALLEPTRIYVKPVLALLRSAAGEGPRAHHRRRPGRATCRACCPTARRRVLDKARWPRPPIFQLAAAGRQRRRGRDAPRVQLRHRHGGGRRADDAKRATRAAGSAKARRVYEIGADREAPSGEPDCVIV